VHMIPVSLFCFICDSKLQWRVRWMSVTSALLHTLNATPLVTIELKLRSGRIEVYRLD